MWVNSRVLHLTLVSWCGENQSIKNYKRLMILFICSEIFQLQLHIGNIPTATYRIFNIRHTCFLSRQTSPRYIELAPALICFLYHTEEENATCSA